MKIKSIKPCGSMVLLKIVEQKPKDEYQKKGALFIPTVDAAANTATVANEKKKVIVYVDAIGPNVPKDVPFQVGDEVFYNQYDLMTLGDDDGAFYGITKYESILAVIEADRT